MKKWYETLFENYGKKYDTEIFTKGTQCECDFIEKELEYDKSKSIIDIGCGTGRHCIELKKRGYNNIVGIDLSDSQLKRAIEKANEEKLDIKFIKQDARDLKFKNEFDIAIMLCEGGFPLMETDEMNYEILKNASETLKDKGKLIFTTLNGLFPIFSDINNFYDSNSNEEGSKCISKNFDLMTFRDYNTTSFIDDDGKEYTLECNERYYIPAEIKWLLKSVGFKKIDIYGAKLGAFSREDKLTPNDFEMLVIAEK